MINSTFKNNECIFLLDDLTGKIKPISVDEKEEKIKEGVNYSEMISKEDIITDEVNNIFKDETIRNARLLGYYTELLAKKIYAIAENNTIIVSLARAGSPIGALLKRYYAKQGLDIPHYSISVIKGKGIDENALNYIRKKHPFGKITFVDAWTGRGSITRELKKSVTAYNEKNGTNISYDLAVIADPAHIAPICATREDICVPNACLNSTVTGLVSRTICNSNLLTENGFHGAITYKEYESQDMTNFFLDEISKYFDTSYNEDDISTYTDVDESYVHSVVTKLKEDFPLVNIDKAKLSIGEASRGLIRRKPLALLVGSTPTSELDFVIHLAKEKGVPIIKYNTFDYKCIALLD